MGNNRGRPIGYVMSKASRLRISQKLRGRSLTEEHKRKISIAMIGNQNRVNPNKRTVMDDLFDEYADTYGDESLGIWLNEHKEEILTTSGIMSEYKLSSMSFIEINVEDISNILVDSLTPETIAFIMPDYMDKLEECYAEEEG